MTERAKIWEKRVAVWRASGESAARYCAARGYTAQSLWRWAKRFDAQRNAPTSSAMQLVRVDRVIASPTPPTVIETSAARLHVELGALRVAIAPGFDRATLVALLDVLEPRTRSAR